jgi:glutathione S-transferase
MEPLLVYGFPSGSSMGLVAALEWLGQPYRLCRVDMLGEMRQPEYRRLNDRVETPVLITPDGQVVSETMAIIRWLEHRDIERRVSFAPGSAESVRMTQLIAFLNTSFTGAFSPLWQALEDQTLTPGGRETLQALGRDDVRRRHDQLEAMIGGSPYLMGATPTFADAVFIGVARWREVHGVPDTGAWPALSALRRRLEADPAVRYAMALEAGEAAAGSGANRGHMALADVLSGLAA